MKSEDNCGQQGEGQKLKFFVTLLWEGGVDAESVKLVETHPMDIGGEAYIDWKAISETEQP